MVEREPIEEFRERIAPFMHLWNTVSCRCIATKVNRRWVNLRSHLELMHASVARSKSSPARLVVDRTQLKAATREIPIGRLDDILQSLREGKLSHVLPSPVYLEPGADKQQFAWWFPGFKGRRFLSDRVGFDWPAFCLSWTGPMISRCLGANRFEELEALLRRHRPSFTDFSELAQKVGVTHPVRGPHNTDCCLDLLAPLPARIESLTCVKFPERKRLDIRLQTARSLRSGSLKVLLKRHSPERGLEEVREQPLRSRQWYTKTINDNLLLDRSLFIPEDVAHVELLVFYKDMETDTREGPVQRWNSGYRVHQELDKREVLLRFLKPKGSKASREFEIGISWLLHLCGFRSVWYGHTGLGEVPDVMAFLERDEDMLGLVMAECTLATPGTKNMRKLAAQAHRVERLVKDAPVLAAIFTPTASDDISVSERGAAAAHKVAIFGLEVIEELHSMASCDISAQQIFKRLQEIAFYDNMLGKAVAEL